MVEKVKLARASSSIVTTPVSDYTMSQYLTTTDTADYKMEVPTDFQKLIKICRFFYRVDPIAGTVINKMVDCAISEIKNQRGQCEEEEFVVYDSLNDVLQEFLRDACLEYLLSGLVVPEYEWSRERGSEVDETLNPRRRVYVPISFWVRDPATITVKNSPISNKKYFYVKVSTDMTEFIRTKGKPSRGIQDEKLYEQLVENYPEFVKAIQNSKGTTVEILLPNARPILSKCLPENAYPTPYMNNTLEALMHKRNMRRMDYAIAARTIGAIQLVKLGNDTFPCTDDKDFDSIKAQMNYRNTEGAYERVFQLFANHTVEISWVFPDTEAMLNQEKYAAVNDDIIAGFGFPRTLITGETIRSGAGGATDLAIFSPIATMETIRDKLITWVQELYLEVKDKNRFKSPCPVPRFDHMKLYRLVDLANIGRFLYMEGSLSRTSRLEMFGIDVNNEIERRAAETKAFKEKGVPNIPDMPFSSPNFNQGTPRGRGLAEDSKEGKENN